MATSDASDVHAVPGLRVRLDLGYIRQVPPDPQVHDYIHRDSEVRQDLSSKVGLDAPDRYKSAAPEQGSPVWSACLDAAAGAHREQADAYSAAPPCPAAEAPRASPAVGRQDSVLPAAAAVEPAPAAHRAS